MFTLLTRVQRSSQTTLQHKRSVLAFGSKKGCTMVSPDCLAGLNAALMPRTFWKGMPEDTNKRTEKRPSDPKFSLGQTVVTRTALAVLSALDIAGALYRHQRGDWGEVGKEDAQANERALKQGERLLSVYRTAEGTRFWIITEWNRSSTTILLPEDY